MSFFEVQYILSLLSNRGHLQKPSSNTAICAQSDEHQTGKEFARNSAKGGSQAHLELPCGTFSAHYCLVSESEIFMNF
jgi:hypothetical protein